MADPIREKQESEDALRQVLEAATTYLGALDGLPAKDRDADAVALQFDGRLPESGIGTRAAVDKLVELAPRSATRSAGPRFFHFVIGGSTPAALAADWLTSTLDNNAGLWVSSPAAAQLEKLSLAWLKDLFGLPAHWGAVMVTGATMANFTALAAARQWWGERQDVDIARDGMTGLPAVPMYSGGFIHASAVKALGMLGMGYGKVKRLTKDAAGRVDLDALDRSLAALGGAPAIVLATAGEVNAGGFDPIEAMAEVAHRHGAWLHVDAAFGLYARLSPELAPLARGVEAADSVITDGHKWLNVPYDSGFAFVRDERLLHAVFGIGAPYFPDAVAGRPDYLMLGPEMSRRARALAVWATLSAYGRAGYREMVERHVRLARRVADQVKASDDFELVEEPVLNVVCFRYRPRVVEEPELDALNRKLGEAVLDDGRVYFGTTVYAGKVAFRPAISNWRTGEADVDLILPVARELGERLRAAVT
ncbi:MAG TPA: aminotransferase class V-fold PLP-dependent enzyme [Candidatus Dormibacteraeota bacterium]|nr:aminotransferase class V-fold PLP-dependent enzyme [Candidatus Dormibacteraeota bacterium]